MAQISVEQAFRTALQRYGAGKLAEAEMYCRRILQGNPEHADSLHLLGVIARLAGRSDASIQLIRRALEIRKDWPEANVNLASALIDCGRFDEAVACCRLAIAGAPADAEAYNNLAAALQKKGWVDQAIMEYERAIALDASSPAIYCNLGTALEEKGLVSEAMLAYERAIGLKPDYAEAHNYHSMLQILRGEFEKGWREYEWRFRCRVFPRPRWNIVAPRWDGSDLNGRSIFLHTEQGFGDAIQFVRYVGLVAERSGKIVLGSQLELQRLFECVPGISQQVTPGESVPQVDVHCPLMSLPMMFGNGLGGVPYLHADAENSLRWKALAGEDDGRLRVGIAWAGGPQPPGRSIAREALADLWQMAGVHFYRLHKGVDASGQDAAGLTDLTEYIADFADAAGLIDQLDLVISIDTAIAHLAGAMGKPVWTLLKFMPDCRWMLEREDTQWYPTMRLFRQPSAGDWDTVIARVVCELRMLVESR